jgi:hypothetical protein
MESMTIPDSLAQIAHGRDHIRTEEFARAICRQHATIRRTICTSPDGTAYGIKPIKIGNKWLWPVDKASALLNGELNSPSS